MESPEAAEPQTGFSRFEIDADPRWLANRDEEASAAADSKKSATTALSREVIIRGAREHNLNVEELRLPRGKMSVLTGLSGSGKSTLAFDVLFAEGQRRYLECLSSYVRQYFKIMEKPDVDQIIGLPPTIAIEQRTSQFGRRSTVGTITEIYHLLRLLYAKLGKQRCPGCGRDLETLTVDDILSRVRHEADAGPLRLLAPLVHGRKGIYQDLFARLKRTGFEQARVDGRYVSLDPIPELARRREHDIEAVLPGLERNGITLDELYDSVNRGLAMGGGILYLDPPGGETRVLSQRLYCPACDCGLAPLDPRLFSFNSRQGYCPACVGIGRVKRISEQRLRGGPDVPLKDGLLSFLQSTVWRGSRREAEKIGRHWMKELGVDLAKSASSLDDATWEAILHGRKGKFPGVVQILDAVAEEDEAWKKLQTMYNDMPCPECGGSRLNSQAKVGFFPGTDYRRDERTESVRTCRNMEEIPFYLKRGPDCRAYIQGNQGEAGVSSECGARLSVPGQVGRYPFRR